MKRRSCVYLIDNNHLDLPFLIDFKYYEQCRSQQIGTCRIGFFSKQCTLYAYVISKQNRWFHQLSDALNPTAKERVVLLFYFCSLFYVQPFFCNHKILNLCKFLWNFLCLILHLPIFLLSLIICHWFTWKAIFVYCIYSCFSKALAWYLENH